MFVVCGSSMLLVASYGGGPAAMAAGWQRQGQWERCPDDCRPTQLLSDMISYDKDLGEMVVTKRRARLCSELVLKGHESNTNRAPTTLSCSRVLWQVCYPSLRNVNPSELLWAPVSLLWAYCELTVSPTKDADPSANALRAVLPENGMSGHTWNFNHIICTCYHAIHFSFIHCSTANIYYVYRTCTIQIIYMYTHIYYIHSWGREAAHTGYIPRGAAKRPTPKHIYTVYIHCVMQAHTQKHVLTCQN